MNNHQRDYNYYEANADVVRLEEITSCERNRRILRWLRDGHHERLISIINLHLGSTNEDYYKFSLSKCNDLGWLGYFIGKSEGYLEQLSIIGSPEGQGGEQLIHALHGISRNQSICKIFLSNLNNDEFAAIARILGNMTQLKRLSVENCVDNDDTLVTLLESGVKLRELSLYWSGYVRTWTRIQEHRFVVGRT